MADNSNVASIGASVHDRVLCSLDRSKIADSLLKIAGSSDEKIFYMHVLEIVSLMYREQSPEDLARFQIHNSNDNNILAKFVEEERLTSIKRNKLVSGRHSNFGGKHTISINRNHFLTFFTNRNRCFARHQRYIRSKFDRTQTVIKFERFESRQRQEEN